MSKPVKLSKRELTPDELEAALTYCDGIEQYSNQRALHAQGVSEGFKAEKCDCGKVLLAHHHYVRCVADECPMKSSDKRTFLDHFRELTERLSREENGKH